MTAINSIPAAVAEFAQAVQTALDVLSLAMQKADLENPTGVMPVFDQRNRPDPREIAGGAAAKAIFAAEGVYSANCLAIFAASKAEPAAVIESRTAGDALLRFAAAAFVNIVGSHGVFNQDGKRLRGLLENVGTGTADGKSASAITARLSGGISPRPSRLG